MVNNKNSFFFLSISAIFLFLFIFSWLNSDPLVHQENFRYIPFLASQGNGSFFSKILDVCSMDDCYDRFRPLSHLFHWLDSMLIVSLNKYIPYHFRSLSFLLMGLATALTLAAVFRRISAPEDWAFAIMLGAFSVTQVTWLVGNYVFFRPGKFITAWLVAYSFYLWVSYSKSSVLDLNTRKKLFYYFLSLFVLSVTGLADEQATFVILLFLGLACVEFLIDSKRTAFIFLTGMATLFQVFSLKVIAPWTYRYFSSNKIDYSSFEISRLIGFKPEVIGSALMGIYKSKNINLYDFSITRFIDFNTLVAKSALGTLIDEFMVIFGDSPFWGREVMGFVFIFFIIPLFVIFIKYSQVAFGKIVKAVFIACYFSASIFLMLYLMGLSFSPSTAPGMVQSGYYALPASLLFFGLFFIGLLKSNILNCHKLKIFIAIVLCICTFSSWYIFNLQHDFFSHNKFISYNKNKLPVGVDENIAVGRIALGYQADTQQIRNAFSREWSECANSFIYFYHRRMATNVDVESNSLFVDDLYSYEPCKSPQAEAQAKQNWLR